MIPGILILRGERRSIVRAQDVPQRTFRRASLLNKGLGMLSIRLSWMAASDGTRTHADTGHSEKRSDDQQWISDQTSGNISARRWF